MALKAGERSPLDLETRSPRVELSTKLRSCNAKRTPAKRWVAGGMVRRNGQKNKNSRGKKAQKQWAAGLVDAIPVTRLGSENPAFPAGRAHQERRWRPKADRTVNKWAQFEPRAKFSRPIGDSSRARMLKR